MNRISTHMQWIPLVAVFVLSFTEYSLAAEILFKKGEWPTVRYAFHFGSKSEVAGMAVSGPGSSGPVTSSFDINGVVVLSNMAPAPNNEPGFQCNITFERARLHQAVNVQADIPSPGPLQGKSGTIQFSPNGEMCCFSGADDQSPEYSYLADVYRVLSIHVPLYAIQAGEKWTSTQTWIVGREGLPGVGGVVDAHFELKQGTGKQVTITRTFGRPGSDEAMIAGDSLTSSPEAAAALQMMASMGVKNEASGSGECLYDAERGQIVSQTITLSSEAGVSGGNISTDPGSSGSISIPGVTAKSLVRASAKRL